MNDLTPSHAEGIAIQALAFLASTPDQIEAFLNASGAEVNDLRSRAQDSDFLGFVLDFILGDDALAQAFCTQAQLTAETLHRGRAALPGGQIPDWT